MLCITEGQYHSRDSNEEKCFKIPSIWEFDGSSQRDNMINTMLYSLLNHLGPRPNMYHHLKTLKLK